VRQWHLATQRSGLEDDRQWLQLMMAGEERGFVALYGNRFSLRALENKGRSF